LDLLLSPGQTLIGGYRIGYDNDTSIGSSGGPVLNNLGEVVAVNGKGKSITQPLFGNAPDPYKFTDNTEPDPNTKRFIRYFAWGIPIETYIEFMKTPAPIVKQTLQSTTVNEPSPIPTSSTINQTNINESNIDNLPLLFIVLYVVLFLILVSLIWIVYKSITDTSQGKDESNTKEDRSVQEFNDQQSNTNHTNSQLSENDHQNTNKPMKKDFKNHSDKKHD
ncbi:MAG: hypothetical protein ACKPE3_39610, partial [Sphaerospermopsis kisseleviana]